MPHLQFPILITNFKTYVSSTGVAGLKLAKLHEKIAKKYNISIGIAVQAPDLRLISSEVSIPVFAQHFDNIMPGKNTGHITPEIVKEAGAYGSLLNHAERQIQLPNIAESLLRARQVGLFTLVCAADVAEAKNIAKFKPDCIAIEPPELIGGDISISTASPEIIKNAVSEISDVAVIVGAGVKIGKDIEIALKLGAKGVLLASGITLAKDPEKVLEELARALK